MPIQPVISNTSPLIGLLGLNCLPLLRDLYTEVWIPREVEKEFLVVDETFYREVLNKAPWIKVVDVADSQSATIYQSSVSRPRCFSAGCRHRKRLDFWFKI